VILLVAHQQDHLARLGTEALITSSSVRSKHNPRLRQAPGTAISS
jgi:hypothetical protein